MKLTRTPLKRHQPKTLAESDQFGAHFNHQTEQVELCFIADDYSYKVSIPHEDVLKLADFAKAVKPPKRKKT